MYRVEDKFVCGERELFYLQSKLECILCADQNQESQYGYTITSVYFDDCEDRHFIDAVNGNQVREKYRIRIYNGSYDVIKLEIKYKRDNRILKKSRRISREQMVKLLKGQCIEDEAPSLDNAVTLFNIAISERKLSPVIIVEYDRKAFVFDAGNVRITLDRNLRFSQRMDLFMQETDFSRTYVPKPDSVLEVKYDEFLPGFIAGILEGGNMRQESYSKYRICRQEAAKCQ